MITRECLRVHDKYINPRGSLMEVTAIGDRSLLYKFVDSGDIGEYYSGILRFLDIFSLAPKPKKKINLIGYITEDGTFKEVVVSATVPMRWKMVSDREIEVEDV